MRGQEAFVDRGNDGVGLVVQFAHENVLQTGLVDDDALAPAARIVELVDVGGPVVAAAVVQVEHQPHVGVPDEILDAG